MTAGPQRVTAAFLKRFDRSDRRPDGAARVTRWPIRTSAPPPGVTTLPHLKDLTITGPFTVTGVSDTVSRQQIFICRPVTAADEIPCATKIVTRLADEAYRRPVTATDLKPLLSVLRSGAGSRGTSRSGIRMALQAILVSPDFLFRLERAAGVARAGQDYRISDVALASRLSYLPLGHAARRRAGEAGERRAGCTTPAVLDAQVHRMLRDPRSFALATRFAAQWLRLQDVDKVHPDAFLFPQYDGRLAEAMKQETENFFAGIVRDDRSVMDLLDGQLHLREPAAGELLRHSKCGGTRSSARCRWTGRTGRGLLGQGSILVETSVANRTDPVLRGKWVLEVLLGQPPPPPAARRAAAVGHRRGERRRQAAVGAGADGDAPQRVRSARRATSMIDPIGLALENFDATGHWRIRDNGVPVDALDDALRRDEDAAGPDGLRAALLKRPGSHSSAMFTENLMAYAHRPAGRVLRHADRSGQIVDSAAGERQPLFLVRPGRRQQRRLPDAAGRPRARSAAESSQHRAAFEGAVGRSEAMLHHAEAPVAPHGPEGDGRDAWRLPFLDAMVPAGRAWAQTPAAKAMGRTRLVCDGNGAWRGRVQRVGRHPEPVVAGRGRARTSTSPPPCGRWSRTATTSPSSATPTRAWRRRSRPPRSAATTSAAPPPT